MGARMTAAEQAEFREARTEGLAAMMDLRTEMAALRTEISKLAIGMAALPNRADFAVELDKRLDRGTYEVAHRALETEIRERARALEDDIRTVSGDLHEFKQRSQGAWQRAAPWVAIGLSLAFGSITALISIAAIIVSIVVTHH